MARRGNPRLTRALEGKGPVSNEELVSLARTYMEGWLVTLGEAGKAQVETDADGNKTVTPGNVQAAIAGLKILQDHLQQTGASRAQSVLDKMQKARRKAIAEMRDASGD